jgi:hypothetical protein
LNSLGKNKKNVGPNNKSRFFLYKNAASVAFGKLKRVNYKFYMRENGGKLMELVIEKINLADFREGTLL